MVSDTFRFHCVCVCLLACLDASVVPPPPQMLWGGLVRPLPINHSLEPKDGIDMNPLAGCKDVKKFRLSFWLLTVCCVVVYGDVIPFNNVASTLLLERDFFKYQPHKKVSHSVIHRELV